MAIFPKILLPKNTMGTTNTYESLKPNLKNPYTDVGLNKKIRFKKIKQKLNINE